MFRVGGKLPQLIELPPEHGGRMIAHTWERQLLFVLGFVLARTVLAVHGLNREKLRLAG